MNTSPTVQHNASSNSKSTKTIAGVKLDKVHRSTLNAFLVEHEVVKGAKAAESMDTDAAVKAAAQYMRQHVDAKELADCDVCGGTSDVNLPRCPFCGVGEDEPTATAAKPASAPNTTAAKPAATPNSNGKKEAPMASAKGSDDKGKASKGKSKKGEPPTKADALAKPEKAAKVIVVEPLPEGVTVQALDKGVAEVQRLKGEAGVGMWALGRKIAELYDQQQWKARMTAESTPAYKSWNAFVVAELGMTAANAYSLMDVAKAFTADDVRAFGTTKLGLVLQAPEEKRPALLEAAKTHSTRDLQKKVQEAKPKDGKKRETGRKATPAGTGGGKAASKKSDKIAVAALLKSATIPLFCKPERGQEPAKPAKKIGDQPVGMLDLANGVRLYVALTEKADGTLALKAVFKRDE